jgi:membrane-bound lytic murein transglycosylase B
MQRRSFLALAAAASAGPALAEAPPQVLPPPGPKPSELLGASGDANFLAWLDDFYARQVAAGADREVRDREISGLSPDPRTRHEHERHILSRVDRIKK